MSPGAAPSRITEDLLAEAWDENADPFTNSPRVTVSHLRKKLGGDTIVTVRGLGYRLKTDGE